MKKHKVLKKIRHIAENIIVSEQLNINLRMNAIMNQSFNESESDRINLYYSSFVELGNAVSDSVSLLYEKMNPFPFKTISEINEVGEMAIDLCTDDFDRYAKEIIGKAGFDHNDSHLFSKAAIAQHQIGYAILVDKLKKDQRRNWPVILSGIWGVVGAVLGALITVLLSK